MHEQVYININKDALITEAARRKLDGWHLTQISSTFKDGSNDLLYTLERDYEMVNLRIELAAHESVDSVSAIYPYSYLYENEIKDLFGVDVRGMNVDFNGTLYQTELKTPFCGDEVKNNG